MVSKSTFSPIPFLPYDPRSSDLDREDARFLSEKKAAEQSVKFSLFSVRYRGAIREANLKSRKRMEDSIKLTKSRVKQLSALAIIQNSIERERTREYLDRSSRRMEEILDIARGRVRSKASQTVPESEIRKKIYLAKSYVDRKAADLNITATQSRDNIFFARSVANQTYHKVTSQARKKIERSKKSAQEHRSEVNLSKANTKNSTSSLNANSSTNLEQVQKHSGEIQTVRSKRNLIENEIEEDQAAKISKFHEEINNARCEFYDKLREIEVSLGSRTANMMKKGQNNMKEMRENMTRAKLLFGLDVKFARHNLAMSARELRMNEIVKLQDLAARRRAREERARAYRKVAAVRNALSLIRSVR